MVAAGLVPLRFLHAPLAARVVPMRTVLILLGAAALLAGCADDADVDAGGASLEFNGEDSGTHSDTAEGCDDGGTLTGSGNIDDGSIQVTVTDGSGDEVFSRTYDDGVEAEGERLQGASGDWRLTVARSGDDLVGDPFRGQYAFTLAC